MRGPVRDGTAARRGRIEDLLRLVAVSATIAIALTAAAPAWGDGPGLVAAYSFDEGSGSVLNDASGNGHLGSISGASWTSGRHGGALSFDGTGAHVALGSLGTFYQTGFTLEAWVRKQSTTKNDVGIVGSWTGGGPMLWVDHIATRYHLTLGTSLSTYLDSGVTPTAGEWQHLAATFDGATARFYVNGSEVANRAFSGSVGSSDTWRIGAYGSTPGGFFDGLIDDVRVYSRALSAGEIQTDMNQPVGGANPSAPTMPGNFAASAKTQTTISVHWDPSTDDVGVSGYTLYRNGTSVETTSASTTSYTFSGLSCSTTYDLGVEAFDASSNVSTRAVQTVSTDPCESATGLVAAYSFDEGSGSVVNDASGNAHTGTVTGATWVAGKYGGALSFNGTNAHVALGSVGTFYQTGFTLQAWVRKSTTKNDVAVLGTWTSSAGGPMIWVDHLATRYHLTLGGPLSNYLNSGLSPVAGQWQHLAATYDGTTARFYVDGVEVASRAVVAGTGSSDVWRIGAYGAAPGNFFDGLIDNVRIYNRALGAGELQTDMNTPVGAEGPPPDTTPPTAPGTLTATAGGGQAALAWGAASDDVGVTRYNVHRSTSAGFVPSAGNRVAQPGGTSYTDSGLTPGVYYYKVTAEDAAGNVGGASNEASATVVAPDTSPPSVSITAPAAGATVSGTTAVAVDAADDVGVAGVQLKLDGANLGAEDVTAPYSASWDTHAVPNGSHTLTAVARDGAGNTTVSAAVVVTVSNSGTPLAGIRAAYAFDDGSGTTALDSSENHQTATVVDGGWTTGKFGGAVSLSGSSSRVDLPALGTFYRSGLTYEAWVYKQSAKVDVAVVGSWTSGQSGAMIWVDHIAGRYRLALGGTFGNYLDSGRAPVVGQWQHVAATYDGSVARFYVDGVQTASATFTGNVGDSNTWRIGAYGTSAGGFFDGRIDNVRIYDRALSASEIAASMNSAIQPEQTPPNVVSVTPADGATGVGIGSSATAKFSEPMQGASITGATFELRDSANNLVPAAVSYNAATRVATLAPQVALQFGTVYRAVLKAGGPKDLVGNALPQEVAWTFTTDAAPSPVLVVASTSNPFGMYLDEILRSEGLTAFTTIDVAFVSPALLSQFSVVVLGETALTGPQVTALTGWVNAGGNLIAMRPDKQLAGLLGLTDATGTIANGYIKVATGAPPGAGIAGATIQYHGTADRYTIGSATMVAPLYSNKTTATTNPAVTLRSVGSNGGQAAAFTYDLARSIVYTRQGNPAWAGQERDGVVGIRSDDLFYGAKSGDAKPDWIDTSRIAIPQADEQQRLLINLITHMERDKLPLPRFWYLPRGEKAAVVMSGDDHSPSQAPGGTVANFDGFKQLSPPGCVVANWECVRATSYVYPDSAISNAQAAAYVGEGFEVALHPLIASCPAAPLSESALGTYFDAQLAAFAAKYTSVPAPASSRTHCVFWPDWASNAKVEAARGIRMDANYYHFPGSWIGTKNGFMTGGGFPMRFADTTGAVIDVYQAHTHLTDESTTAYATAIAALLDNAIGPEGYYGAFGINMHTDNPSLHPGAQAIVQAAQTRGVPVISYKQLLDWTDGRNNSTIRGLSWNAGKLTFVTTVAAGANGLQTLLPTAGPSGTLSALTCAGSPKPYTVETIKGVQYAVFDAVNGTCQATYS
jgi:hypothetical protein